MILGLEGLFRLDVAIFPDTVRTTVRSFTGGELTVRREDYPATRNFGYGEIGPCRPTATLTEFAIAGAGESVAVSVILATLWSPERGTHGVTAQAVVRRSRPAA
jgi:hypothetical protein